MPSFASINPVSHFAQTRSAFAPAPRALELPQPVTASSDAPDSSSSLGESYTEANLCFESLLAALWNSLCLLYLLRRESPWSPLVILIEVVIFIPLVIGLSAGVSSLFLPEAERVGDWELRVRAVAAGACSGGLFVLAAHLVEGQSRGVQANVAAFAIVAQAIIVRRAILDATSEDAAYLDEPIDIAEALELAQEKSSIYYV